jgi:hypothetical protein
VRVLWSARTHDPAELRGEAALASPLGRHAPRPWARLAGRSRVVPESSPAGRSVGGYLNASPVASGRRDPGRVPPRARHGDRHGGSKTELGSVLVLEGVSVLVPCSCSCPCSVSGGRGAGRRRGSLHEIRARQAPAGHEHAHGPRTDTGSLALRSRRPLRCASARPRRGCRHRAAAPRPAGRGASPGRRRRPPGGPLRGNRRWCSSCRSGLASRRGRCS